MKRLEEFGAGETGETGETKDPQRLRRLLEKARQDKNVILFIDEPHVLIQEGSNAGSTKVDDALERAIWQGKVTIWGVISQPEYTSYFGREWR